MNNPFLNPARQDDLYGQARRLATRSNALMRAKTAGHGVPDRVVALVRAHRRARSRLGFVVDIGCGRGTSTRVLAEQLRPRHLLGLDAAPALIADARRRVGSPGTPVGFLRADFHRMPLPPASCDLVIAAFCLYHSPRPQEAVAEIARILASGGLAVVVTKAVDSYREMDALIASAGIDPHAPRRESLYTAAHSDNLADLARSSLDVIAVEHEEHRFTFDGHDHAAEYLATNPKYEMAPGLYGNPGALAATLHEFLPDQPVTTSSRITYVLAQPGGSR